MGVQHALEADHLAAVATLVSDGNRYKAIKEGIMWGVGHTSILLLTGLFALYMDIIMPEKIINFLEFSVGIILLFLGSEVIHKVLKSNLHTHIHEHKNGIRHTHVHLHSKKHGYLSPVHEHYHFKDVPLRAFLIGIMHGMAGSAVLILFVLQSVKSTLTGIFYIICFGAGTIIGMAALSSLFAASLQYSFNKKAWLYPGIRIIVGFTSILIGLFIIFQVVANMILMN